MFTNKVLLITGGTGSFGNAVLNKFLNSGISEIRIFSRDEKKQHDMRVELQNNKIKFYIGDIRDFDSINSALNNVDYVFHAAALKQVPSCEFYPIEAVKTNILGTENPDLYRPYLHLFARDPELKIHIYGKEVRPGRKVGHATVVGDDLASLRSRAAHAIDYISGVVDE